MRVKPGATKLRYCAYTSTSGCFTAAMNSAPPAECSGTAPHGGHRGGGSAGGGAGPGPCRQARGLQFHRFRIANEQLRLKPVHLIFSSPQIAFELCNANSLCLQLQA